jgi:hypothetical protein
MTSSQGLPDAAVEEQSLAVLGGQRSALAQQLPLADALVVCIREHLPSPKVRGYLILACTGGLLSAHTHTHTQHNTRNCFQCSRRKQVAQAYRASLLYTGPPEGAVYDGIKGIVVSSPFAVVTLAPACDANGPLVIYIAKVFAIAACCCLCCFVVFLFG